MDWLEQQSLAAAVVVAVAVGAACAALSPLVVARRWAFAAEGIAHSGFGGAGTAWLLAAMFPALDRPGLVPLFVGGFGLLAAAAMVALARRRAGFDVAVGAVLAATLAWGFVGREVYVRATGAEPAGFEALLLGRLAAATWGQAVAAVAVAGLVLGVLVLLRRPVVAFALDPALAGAAGVPERPLHYGLMLLVSVGVVAGVGMVGSLLVTALLVLPGAVAGRFARSPGGAVLASVAIGAGACAAALLAGRVLPWLPTGPAVVLALFAAFLASLAKR